MPIKGTYYNATLGAAPTSSSHLGFFGASTNITTTQATTNGGGFLIGSITLPSAGTYLISAQSGAANGGGGGSTYFAFYLNHSTAGSLSGSYGPTGTIGSVIYPFSNNSLSSTTIGNINTIVTVTASTTYNGYIYVIYSGNCQFSAGSTFINYLRLG
jgi:hypothetical protein